MKPLPTWEDFNVPVLSVLSDGVVRTLRELRRDVAAAIGLTDEQVAEVLPSGQPRADNRIGWAASYLNRVDALNRPTRGCYEITAFGRELLAKRPSGITESHLKAVAKSGDEWWITRRTVDGQTEVVQVEEPTTTLDPTEQVEQGIARIHEEVASELLSRLHGQEPAFFESAVVRLLLAMGYGGVGGRGVTTARSNDGGIDGVIDQDMFGTSFDTSADRFQNYYKDLSLRLKRREIDLVIVVNMFLTGFDATTLNTLWVDKNLRAHGLIQAFSRTNRILNSVKTFGNIVSFRDLEEETNDAIALFGNKDARGVVLLKPYDEYHDDTPTRSVSYWSDSRSGSRSSGRPCRSNSSPCSARFCGGATSCSPSTTSPAISCCRTGRCRDYTSVYLDLYAESRVTRDAAKESIVDDVVFEIELVKQVEINVDYILMLVEQHRKAKGGDGDDKEIRAAIERAIDSSPSLRNKKDLIEAFVDSLSASAEVDVAWQAFVASRRREELDRIIDEENLKPEATYAFVETSFRDGSLQPSGTAVTRILPPVSRFAQDGGHAAKKRTVLDKLNRFFERFNGLGG